MILVDDHNTQHHLPNARAEAISIFPEGQGLTLEEERQQVRVCTCACMRVCLTPEEERQQVRKEILSFPSRVQLDAA